MKESREFRVRPLKKKILRKRSLKDLSPFLDPKKRAQKLRNNRNRERQFPPPRRRGDLSAERMNYRRGRGGLREGRREGREGWNASRNLPGVTFMFLQSGAVARSHIKQINLVRGSVYLRAPAPFRSFHTRDRIRLFDGGSGPTLLLFYLNSSSKWGRSRGYRGSRERSLESGRLERFCSLFTLLPLFLLFLPFLLFLFLL